jgi:hypothetical protein
LKVLTFFTGNMKYNPYNLPAQLFEVWHLMGRPQMWGDGTLPWYGRVIINEQRVTALERFMRARNPNGRFSKTIIDDLAEIMLRGAWVPDSDPITWLVSSVQAQGNHRFLAVKKAKVSISFNFQLGVANEAEHELGRVFPWKRCDLIQETGRTVAVAMLACKSFLGSLKATLGRGYDSDIKLVSEMYRDNLNYTFALIPDNVKRFSRTAISLAVLEGAIIDQQMNGSTETTERFVKSMRGELGAACPWGNLFNKFVIDHETGSTSSQKMEYHSAVLALKRALLKIPFKKDSMNKNPDKSSDTAEWGNLSGGAMLQTNLDEVIATRVEMIRETNPKFGAGTKVFYPMV